MKKDLVIIIAAGKSSKNISRAIENTGRAKPAAFPGLKEAGPLLAEGGARMALVELALKGKPGGVATARIIKKNYGLPVAFITAPGDTRRVESALKEGPLGFVPADDPAAARGALALLLAHRAADREPALDMRGDENSRLYRLLIEDMYNGVGIQDRNGIFTFVNRRLCEMLGYEEAEMVGRPVTDFLDRENRFILSAQMEMRRRGEKSSYELTWNRKDGAILPSLVSSSPITDAEGRYNGSYGIISDLSDRNRMLEALSSSERLMSSIIDFLPDATFVINRQKEVVAWNRSIERMTGVGKDRIIGKGNFAHSLAFYGEKRPMLIDIALEKCENAEELYDYLSISGCTVTAEVYAPQVFNNRGAHLWGIATPLYDENGEIVGAIESIKDITDRKKTEEDLRVSEANLRALLESTDISFMLINRDFTIRAYNTIAWRRSQSFYGREMREGDIITSFMPDEKTKERLEDHLRRAFKGERFSIEGKVRPVQGPAAWFEFSFSPVHGHEGVVQGVLFSATDITARKNANEALRMNQVRMETLLGLNNMIQSTDDEITGFAIEQGVALTGSAMGYLAFLEDGDRVLKMHAWSAAAMRECGIKDRPLVYPMESTGLWGEAVRRRKAIITNNYHEPNPLKKGYPEGHVPLNRHMNIPIFDGETIVGVAGVANKEDEYNETDVQQLALLMQGMWQLLRRKKYEEALRRSEESLSITLASIADAIIATDNDFLITRMNPVAEALTGWTFKEAAGRPITEVLNIVDEKTEHPVAGAFANVLEKDRIIRSGGSTMLLDRLGGRRRIAQSASPIRDAGGEVLGIVIVFRDITERHTLEEQLRQSQKIESIGRLAGGVAHDFNNLLTTIIGNAELTLARTEKNTTPHELLTEIYEAGRRGALLTKQLLAFSRKQMLEMKVVNLNEIIRGFEKILRRLMRENIELVLDLDDTAGIVRGDYVQIEQILMNMAVNSIDAMPDGGVLTIKTGSRHIGPSSRGLYKRVKHGEYAAIIVEDTGHGMDTATMKNIFDPFFTTKELTKGTGLGLSTVYGIVQQHGGDIFVKSTPGKGTVFEILIPGGVDGAPETPPAAAGAPRGGSETILLVEDNHEVRKLAKRFLERMGYRVIETDDPSVAVELGGKNPVDLLLTDVIMPGMNGKQLYEKLVSGNPGLKVLYMSGYTDDIILTHGIQDDSVNFIQKPFILDEFSRKIREVLKGRPERAE